MFRQMLMAGASRRAYAPENDQGFEDQDDVDTLDEELEDEDPDDQDDDPEDGDADEGDDEQEGEPAQRPTRGQNRVATLSREAREAKDRADRAERELQDLRAQQTRAPAETPAARAERLAGMTEAQRLEYLIQEQGQNFQAQIAQTNFNNWESGDQAAFRALSATNPAVAKLAAKVEVELKAMRAQGQNASRETIAKYLLGEAALNRAPRAAAKGARTAAAGRERQQGRPGAGRGDVAPGGARKGSEAAQRRARLEGLEI